MLTLVSPPAVLPVTLAEAKAHLRVDFAEDDAAIEAYVRAAAERYDGRDGLLGRCLVSQTWEFTLDHFPLPAINLPLGPVQSVSSISYIGNDGMEHTLAPEAYSNGDGRIIPLSPWPDTMPTINAVRVLFTAGFGDSAEDVPATIRQVILTRACQLYDNRDSIADLPDGVDGYVRDHRTFVF